MPQNPYGTADIPPFVKGAITKFDTAAQDYSRISDEHLNGMPHVEDYYFYMRYVLEANIETAIERAYRQGARDRTLGKI